MSHVDLSALRGDNITTASPNITQVPWATSNQAGVGVLAVTSAETGPSTSPAHLHVLPGQAPGPKIKPPVAPESPAVQVLVVSQRPCATAKPSHTT